MGLAVDQDSPTGSSGPEAGLGARFRARRADLDSNLDPDWDGRARLLVGACAVIGVAGLASFLWTHFWGPQSNRGVTLVLAPVVVLIPLVLRETRSLPLATHLLNAVILSVLVALMVNTSGQTLPPFICISVPPLLASLITGTRAGLFWASASAVALMFGLSLSPVEATGSVEGLSIDPSVIDRGKGFGSFLMLAMVTATSIAAWQLRCKSLNALQEAKDLANERYKQVLEQQSNLVRVQTDDARLRDAFFSHVSHELRTPLTPLHQFLTLVLDEIPGPLGAEQREFLEIALRNATHMDKLIGNLTDAARVQSGVISIETSVIDLASLVERSIASFEAEAALKEVEIVLSGRSDLHVLTDPRRTLRVLRSLIENAVGVAPEGSRIEVTLGRDGSDPDLAIVSVSDEGPGVDAESSPHLFAGLAPLRGGEWQSRDGLGLGLYIARALVQQLGGRLWFAGDKPPGATFCFSLPRYSLESTLGSLLDEYEAGQTGELGVLMVSMSEDPDRLQGSMARAVWDELVLVLYPHADVMLPVGSPEAPEGRHVAITGTTQETLPKLLKRLRAHFAETAPFSSEEGFEVRFEGTSVDLVNSSRRSDMIAANALRIRRAIGDLAGA